MPLTNVTRRSIIDISGVLDTPLKLLTINNCKIMSTVKQFFRGEFSWGGQCSRGQFSWESIFAEGNFPGGNFLRGLFPGDFFSVDFFPGGIFPEKKD